MGRGKQRWKFSFHSSPSAIKKEVPNEFVCSISGSLMADPVVVSSGQSFEGNCVQACKSLDFNPILSDGSMADFSTVIPNLALKSAILTWCDTFHVEHPKPIDSQSSEKLVRTLMASQNPKSEESNPQIKGFAETGYDDVMEKKKFSLTDSELTQRPSQSFSSSEESVSFATPSPTTPLRMATRPCCYSSSSSSDIDTQNPNSVEEDEFIVKLRSNQMFEQEEAVISLRKITRTREDSRLDLCTTRLLSALRPLIISRHSTIQVNAVAVLVNLSIEDKNKVKIVRSGIVPPVIDVLKGGFPAAQDHAAGALFSLALNDHNKMAIGVLGALEPLLHALRSDSEWTRNDSALALYHLTLVQSNQSKLVKLGSVHSLLGMVKSGHLSGRVILVLCNLATCVEGRAAMLDAGAVDCFVGMLREDEFDSELNRENCVVALFGLSQGGFRFKGLAKEAGAEEVLKKVEKGASARTREKAKRILEMMRGRDEGLNWEEVLNSG